MASEYQLTSNPRTVQRMADNAFIPDDPANRDYQTYLAWVAEGNTPDPAPPPIYPTTIPSVEFFARFTEDELIAMHSEATTDPEIAVGITLNAAADYIEVGAAPSVHGAMLVSWLDKLVTAGCITQARVAEITRPPEFITPA
jgi:hypothetical protein